MSNRTTNKQYISVLEKVAKALTFAFDSYYALAGMCVKPDKIEEYRYWMDRAKAVLLEYDKIVADISKLKEEDHE